MYIQSLQPTLITNNSYLHVVADRMGKLTIKVLDVQGMVAKRVTTNIQAGNQQLDLNLTDLTNGNYILNVFNGDIFLKSIPFKKQ
jgi:hypothetical protein